jgi:hypothetical protein
VEERGPAPLRSRILWMVVCGRRLAIAEEKALERAHMEEEVAKAEAAAAAREAQLRREGVTRRLDLQTAIAAKAHMRAAEHDEKYVDAETTRRQEAEFQSKVQGTLRATDPPTWHGRRKFDWNS